MPICVSLFGFTMLPNLASATEPFGLKFGSPRSANPYKVLKKVELRKKEIIGVSSNFCARAVFTARFPHAPKHWKINSNDVDGFEKVPYEAKSFYDMFQNKYGADFSINKKVTAYIYKIKNMLFCVGYFEDKLFMLYSPLGQWWNKWDIIRNRFNKRYEISKMDVSDKKSPFRYIKYAWIDKKNKVYIGVQVNYVTGSGISGYLLYTYAPIKSLQVREMMKKHIAKYNEETKKSGF